MRNRWRTMILLGTAASTLAVTVISTAFFHKKRTISHPSVRVQKVTIHKPSRVKVSKMSLIKQKVHTVSAVKKLRFHKVIPSIVTAVGKRRLDPMAGVWDPGRLRLINPFMTVSGVVEDIVHESSDADYHIDLLPDPKFKYLLNNYNYTLQHGDLVVEVIALDDGKVPIPAVGEHITATGAYVIDTGHDWTEIHQHGSSMELARHHIPMLNCCILRRSFQIRTASLSTMLA